MEVFAIAEDNGLWHKHQESPNGRFGNWETRGTPAQDITLTERFTVGRNQDGRQEVFAVASDGNVWQIFQTPNGRWSQWTKLGQPPEEIRDGDRITVGRNIDGRQELFAIGGDGSCWHIWQVAPNVGWSDWESIGKPRDTFDRREPSKDRDLSEPVVQENFDGHLEVFVPGNGAFCNRWQEGDFRRGPAHIVWRPGGWNAKPKMRPDVNITRLEPTLNLQHKVEVLAIGDDGALWNARQIDQEPFWSTSDNLGSPPAQIQGADRLTVGRNANGRLEVLVVGQDGAIWHIVQSGAITVDPSPLSPVEA